MRSLAFLILILLSFGHASANSDDTLSAPSYSHIYGGVYLGSGYVMISQNGINSDRKGRLALGFYGGYKPAKWIRTGILLNGWLIEAFGNADTDPEKGISIGNTCLQVDVFPIDRKMFFLSIAGGLSTYTNHNFDKFTSRGNAIQFGLGYAFRLGKNCESQLRLNYCRGAFRDIRNSIAVVENQHYDVFEIVASIGFY